MLRNFTIKNCLFGATNVVKNNDKDKWAYSGYGIAFDGKEVEELYFPKQWQCYNWLKSVYITTSELI